MNSDDDMNSDDESPDHRAANLRAPNNVMILASRKVTV